MSFLKYVFSWSKHVWVHPVVEKSIKSEALGSDLIIFVNESPNDGLIAL